MFWRSSEINEEKWDRYIHRDDWYLKLLPDYKRLSKRVENDVDLKAALKEQAYAFFERHLIAGDLALGESGPNWDEERRDIDTVVIHHTANPSGMRVSRLNAMHLLRLYASHYIYPSKADRYIKGQPIWSGHFGESGQQVFYSYHWLVREDGTVERLLEDGEIGWQAGEWDINTRSVAICLDGDYRMTDPPRKMLAAVSKLLSKHYPQVGSDRVLGHGEVNPKTDCPGGNFQSWRNQLVKETK